MQLFKRSCGMHSFPPPTPPCYACSHFLLLVTKHNETKIISERIKCLEICYFELFTLPQKNALNIDIRYPFVVGHILWGVYCSIHNARTVDGHVKVSGRLSVFLCCRAPEREKKKKAQPVCTRTQSCIL